MTVTAEEDFRDFVIARWGELEPVAQLVTLDAPTARRVTTDALADLHGQWAHLLDEGMPGAAARRTVLAGALAAARHHSSARAGAAARPGPAPTRHADPRRRRRHRAAAGACGAPPRWSVPCSRPPPCGAWTRAGSPTCSGCRPLPFATPISRVRRRLLGAHTAARAAAGWEPAEWALDRDLEDALDLLLADHADPPDAVALVDERHRRVRRRSVVLGTGATLAAGAAAFWFVDGVATGTASEAAPQPPRPGDPVWAPTSSWPARGRLAADARVAALVAGASPRAHLLWADDLAGQRVVVAATADASGTGGTLVRMWTGPRGAAADTLLPTGLVRDRVTFIDDVVPVAVEAGPDDEDGAGAVLLLARPTVLEASYSPVVAYARNGGVGRQWTEVGLRDGVATVALRGPMPPTFRVRLDGFDAGPLGATPLGLPVPDDPKAPLGDGLLEALGPFVSACTGLPVSAVQSTVVLEAAVDGDVLVPLRLRRAGRAWTRRGRPHRTAERGAAAHRPGRRRRPWRGGPGRRRDHPGDRVDRDAGPFAARLPGFSEDVSRFLVVAPGAARAQLVGTASNTYPASEVTALRGGTGCPGDRRRAAGRAVPAGHLGPARPEARRVGDAVPAPRPA